MHALLLALLIDSLDQVATLAPDDQIAVVSVDRRPDVFPVGPDACSDEKSQPLLGPVVFGNVADAWPEEIEIEGVVTGLMPSYCGFACRAGALRVHVVNGPTMVHGRDLYVAVWCIPVNDTPEFCGRTVKLRARKLVPPDAGCGLEGQEFFASGGMPYYAVKDAMRSIVVEGVRP